MTSNLLPSILGENEAASRVLRGKPLCTAAVERSGNRFQSGGNFRFMNRTTLFREKFQNCLFPFCRHIHFLTVAKKYILFQPPRPARLLFSAVIAALLFCLAPSASGAEQSAGRRIRSGAGLTGCTWARDAERTS